MLKLDVLVIIAVWITVMVTDAPAGIINHNGLDWMSLDMTHQYNPTEVTAAHSGWRYATRRETSDLLSSFWGGNYSGYSKDNAIGARNFLDTFGSLVNHQPETYRIGLRYSYFIFGNEPTCGPSLREYCTGIVTYFDNQTYKHLMGTNVKTGIPTQAYTAGSGPGGFFSEQAGLDAGLSDYNIGRSEEETNRNGVGHLLVREDIPQPAVVPAPAVIWLFLGGLGLLFMRYRRDRP